MVVSRNNRLRSDLRATFLHHPLFTRVRGRGILRTSYLLANSVHATHLPAPWPTLVSYGLVQHLQEPLARGLLDDLDVRLVLAPVRDPVVVDNRLSPAPLPARLHGHEAALGPPGDPRVEGDGHRYRVRQLEPPVPVFEDDPLDVDAELRQGGANAPQLRRLLGREGGVLAGDV